mmetsp:Transcript_1512/g.3936  ORF Transcript_1512/g.3936 Transcript_1512/m.3936 type:complete len:161 (+) Transcript_1512:143-625(+)
MTTSRKILRVLLTISMVSSIRAFGPRLERLSHSYSFGHGSVSKLYAYEAEQNHYDDFESLQPHNCEFDLVSAPFDILDEFSQLFSCEGFDGTFPFLQEQADAMALGSDSSEFDLWENEPQEMCGDNCKECEIPKDWFAITEMEEIDVMEFLGVTRVKPLC